MACTRHPRQIPSEVSHAALRPRVSSFLVTRGMSAPGVIVSSAATPMNTKKRESSIAFESTTIIAEDAALSNHVRRYLRMGGRQRLSGSDRQVAPAEGDGPEGRRRLAHGHRAVLAEGWAEPCGFRSGRLRIARWEDGLPRRRRPRSGDEAGQQGH